MAVSIAKGEQTPASTVSVWTVTSDVSEGHQHQIGLCHQPPFALRFPCSWTDFSVSLGCRQPWLDYPAFNPINLLSSVSCLPRSEEQPLPCPSLPPSYSTQAAETVWWTRWTRPSETITQNKRRGPLFPSSTWPQQRGRQRMHTESPVSDQKKGAHVHSADESLMRGVLHSGLMRQSQTSALKYDIAFPRPVLSEKNY